MGNKKPEYYDNVEKCVDDIIQKVGKKIMFGMPLGLGKPNELINAIYSRAKADPTIHLTIVTALSLEKPIWSSDLERRFLEPFVDRLFNGYAELQYMLDLRRGQLPANVELTEFYAKAGSYLGVKHAQQNYISSNYTHAWRDSLDRGVNVVSQIVSKKEINGKTMLSMSCNPEVALDLTPALRQKEKEGRKVAVVAQVNQNLPFMYGDAVVPPDTYDMVLDSPQYYSRLFGAPKMSVTTPDYMIGMNASALIRDGGTLQIGIGSLGDALCYGLQLREEKNDVYRKFFEETGLFSRFSTQIEKIGGLSKFDEGIIGSTEMLVDGYLHLIKSGVVKRKTYNNYYIQKLVNEKKIQDKVTPQTLEKLLEEGAIQAQLTEQDVEMLCHFGIFKDGVNFSNGALEYNGRTIEADLSKSENLSAIIELCLGDSLKNGILIHGGFFLGPEDFYRSLNDMTEEERKQIFMTSVLNVNQLYENKWASEQLKLLQRKEGRFVNACLMVTLTGAVVSDGLENGQVVSGVGGQYNFVSQAHALPGGRSILMCRATRTKGKDVRSNIVYNYGHTTIPRHLRDFVVTEYGIAELRGKTDKEVMQALINIADSRFQESLLQQAKSAGKVPESYEIPDQFRNNFPQRLEDDVNSYRKQGYFPPFPFGTDFTAEELVIGKALKGLKAKMSEGFSKVSSLGKAATIRKIPEAAKPYLQRMQLDNPKTTKEKMMQKLVVYALSSQGSI